MLMNSVTLSDTIVFGMPRSAITFRLTFGSKIFKFCGGFRCSAMGYWTSYTSKTLSSLGVISLVLQS